MKKIFALIISMLSGREMKTLLLVLSLLWATVLPMESRAQYSDYYYHRVGDTVEWDTRIGYYSWWEWEYFFQHNLKLFVGTYSTTWADVWETARDSCIQLQYFYTPVPLKIIGIAGYCVRGERTEPSHFLDTNEFKEYLFIYEAGPGDTFTQVSATQWSPFDPKRYIHVKLHCPDMGGGNDSCCIYAPQNYYIPISEYYFDSAVWVTDSFYVGGSYFGDHHHTSPILRTQYGAVMNLGTKRCDTEVQGWPHVTWDYQNEAQTCTFPSIMKKRRTCDMNNNIPYSQCGWTWFPYNSSSVIIYPIIEVDTTVPPGWACDTIKNVQVTVSGSSATVTWDGFPNYSRILLRYGRRNEPPSQWRQEDVTGSTLHTLTGLPPSSMWGVSLMAECDTSKKETPWSAPTYFFVPADTTGGGTQGIDEGTTQLSRLTFLQPNPATDQVRVTSSFGLSEIELWTVDGVMVYHAPHSGHEASIDVSWLRAGTYIMAIHTHNGTTHKRLLKY